MNQEKKFRELLHVHTAIITKICRVYTDNPEDFNDYYQEVALQLWRSYQTFRGDSQLSTWVYRVALNVCLSQFKKEKKKKVALAQQEAVHEYAIHTSNSDEPNERVTLLYQAIKQLKEIDRALILLFLEEKSYKEISDIMGISVSLVGVRLNRIKQQIKKVMHG